MAASSVLAAAVAQTSSLGIYTLFNLSHERLPSASNPSSSIPTSSPTSASFTLSPASSFSSLSERQFVSKNSTYLTVPTAVDKPPSLAESSVSSSPRQHPTGLSDPILEEGDESESEGPNEPVTPVSGRQSSDFQHVESGLNSGLPSVLYNPSSSHRAPTPKPPLILSTAAAPPPPLSSPETPDRTASSAVEDPTPSAQQSEPGSQSRSRRSTRTSSTGLIRSMSSIFRRSNPSLSNASSSTTSQDQIPVQRNAPTRRWSMNRSSPTTRSNSPPSPGSPALEMRMGSKGQAQNLPGNDDFLGTKKNRASTGLGLKNRIHFVSQSNGKPRATTDRRRASSFDQANVLHQQQQQHQQQAVGYSNNASIPTDRSIWGVAEAGTGAKARRMSLSLPDDFTVDVAELQAEFEYPHKFLGRHAKNLGKGATSKVRMMVRKGFPNEVYAVKEFRGKSSKETREEYEKKIKSEYSIAKSLYHPNIVSTVRLCTDHGRWNHVMEYCSEGDLFSLVEKKYLKNQDREKDRICLFKQLVQGINYLHSNGIAHRDIKLENLLITKDSKLKITDFGVSEVFSGIHPGVREAGGQCGINMGEIRLCSPGICGSEPYISPEVLSKSGAYDPRGLDVWGAAVVMINLIFGGALWSKAAPGEKIYDDLVKGWKRWESKHPDSDCKITETDYPAVMAFDVAVNPPALRRVLLQMLNPNPARRSTIADVINNRWIKNAECCQVESYDDPVRVIDASKKISPKSGNKKIFCHNHLPPQNHGSHTLPKMPGNAGY